MKTFILIIPIFIILSSCSRPATPPTTPVQPPTVEAESAKVVD